MLSYNITETSFVYWAYRAFITCFGPHIHNLKAELTQDWPKPRKVTTK